MRCSELLQAPDLPDTQAYWQGRFLYRATMYDV